MPSYRAFRQIKIRHIFIMQFGGYFVKFYSRQIFRPYGSPCMINTGTWPHVQYQQLLNLLFTCAVVAIAAQLVNSNNY